ncbi:MAG: TRAM domain-containing protein, partial [Verrucomicrobiales bacterium]|nr:TRAM domain-containing protein [Verrucomicrobiales bacterium]
LQRMRRTYTRDLWMERIATTREKIAGVTVATDIIVGFPGETEADFEELLAFIEDSHFERAGVFNYSREEGTRADKMEGHLHHMTRKSRWNRAMQAIQNGVETYNRNRVGQRIRVLVEEPGIARGEHDAPDIDTTVFVDATLPVGQFADVTIRDWRGYDLVAE